MDQFPPSRTWTPTQRIASFAMAMGLLLLGLYTLQEFLRALVWAAVLAVALWPVYDRIRPRAHNRLQAELLPLLFAVGVALVFLVPLVLVGFQLAEEGRSAADWVRQAQENGIREPAVLHRIPYGDSALTAWWDANLAQPGGARDLVGRMGEGRLGNVGRDVGTQVLRRLTLFLVTLVTLFFLFRDGPGLLVQLRRASTKAFGPVGERVGAQIVASIHGTVSGLVLVGLGEGVVLGVVYFIAGVLHATVFGLLTGIAAMIPFAAPVMIGLAAILLVAKGAAVAGAVVFAFGLVVTFVSDHFIRPVLIGGTTRLPFLWVLLGILGGVEIWGLLGLFIGPAIMAALILIWREYAGEGGQA